MAPAATLEEGMTVSYEAAMSKDPTKTLTNLRIEDFIEDLSLLLNVRYKPFRIRYKLDVSSSPPVYSKIITFAKISCQLTS